MPGSSLRRNEYIPSFAIKTIAKSTVLSLM